MIVRIQLKDGVGTTDTYDVAELYSVDNVTAPMMVDRDCKNGRILYVNLPNVALAIVDRAEATEHT